MTQTSVSLTINAYQYKHYFYKCISILMYFSFDALQLFEHTNHMFVQKIMLSLILVTFYH